MSELILHHYPTSPFAEKARLLLGFKQLSWRSVMIPPVMPKPDLVALTGGYRKTPVLQVGADVYCDTALIARRLEQEKAVPALFPEGQEMVAASFAQWADAVLFQHAVSLAFAGVHRRAFRQAAAGIPQGLHGRSQPAIQRRQRRPPAAGTGAPPVAGIHGATGAPVVARGRRFPVRRSVRRRLRRGALPVVPQGHAGHSAAGRRLPAGAGLVGTGARLRPWRASRDECGGSPGGGSRQPARGIAGRILQRPQRFPARPGGRHRRHRLRCRRGTGRTALRRQRGTHPAPRRPAGGYRACAFPRLGFRIEAR